MTPRGGGSNFAIKGHWRVAQATNEEIKTWNFGDKSLDRRLDCAGSPRCLQRPALFHWRFALATRRAANPRALHIWQCGRRGQLLDPLASAAVVRSMQSTITHAVEKEARVQQNDLSCCEIISGTRRRYGRFRRNQMEDDLARCVYHSLSVSYVQ
ncbi:hypothetical protein T10_466 [Trichinella papuae]|uniref:Uncharacterized protein n=1 Tax=Trichinella papuae TaxID=268474 RepID=A0A0V1N153_9BILA|nr:hypothetical protein T10_466 [Trichinella papuae]